MGQLWKAVMMILTRCAEDWEDSDSESNDGDNGEVGSEPGHQQPKLVGTNTKFY